MGRNWTWGTARAMWTKANLERGLKDLESLPSGTGVPVTSQAQAESVLDQYRALADTAAGKVERDATSAARI